MPEQKPQKRQISLGTGLKRLLIAGLLVWVVVNPLGAATSVHDIAYWIGGFFG